MLAGGVFATGRSLTLSGGSHNPILDKVAQAADADVNLADYERYRKGQINWIFS